MLNMGLKLRIVLFLLSFSSIYVSQLFSGGSALADEVIGTQTTMETPMGNITQCAGNLLAPPTICTGTSRNDTIVTSPRSGTIYGWGGDDKIQGLLGTEVTFGNDGNDVVVGEAGPNILFGTGGSMLFGESGNDQIIGGIDHDVMSGGPGQDTFVCNGKQDVIVDFKELEDMKSGDCVIL